MKRRVALAAALVTLAITPTAAAQGPVLQVLEGTAPEDFRWSPPAVTIKAGETVTWRFDGTNAPHNVVADSGNWQFSSVPAIRPAPMSYKFDTPGVYGFVCSVHQPYMAGTVSVTDASGAPPPPPPLPPVGEQWWQNDQQPPAAVEVSDEVRPRLRSVRVTAVRNGARVRFRLSERARVVVRLKLAGVTVKRASRTFRAGAGRLTVRDRRMHGRYRVEVFARDQAGNRSRIALDRLTVR